MDCITIRENISAGLDGEPTDLTGTAIDGHLGGCGQCRGWQEAAAAVTRQARLSPAAPVADLSELVLDRVRLGRRATVRQPVLRWALGLVGMTQALLAYSQLIAPVGMAIDGMGMAGHLGHESAAFNLALGVAMGFVALRPGRAGSQLPVLVTAVGMLAVLSALDLTKGTVGWDRVLTHLPAVLGLLITAILGRHYRHRTGPGHPAPGDHRGKRAAHVPTFPHRFGTHATGTDQQRPPAAQRRVA